MSISSWPLLAVVFAASTGAQDVARPVTVTAPVNDAAADATETERINRAVLAATADQTARIVREQDLNTRNLAAFAQAQAAYARDVKTYEAEKAAAARKAADAAAAYQVQMAAWGTDAERHQRSTPKPAEATAGDTAKPKPKRVCGFETQTGSNMPVRVCH